MKSKALYSPTWAFRFDESSIWCLPKVLNFHRVTPQELASLRVAQNREFVYLLVMGLLEHKSKAPVLCRYKAMARHLRRTTPGWNTEDLLRIVDRISSHMGPTWRGLMEGIDRKFIDDNFYWDKATQTTKAEVVGQFSYNDSDDLEQGELELWETITCPSCGHRENVRSVFEDLSDSADFEPLTGPYHRCRNCDKAVRPSVARCDELPMEAYPLGNDEAWDDYVERLDGLLQDMEQHLVGLGLPKPDGLRVDAVGFGWRKVDGYTTIKVDAEQLARAFSVNSDYHIDRGAMRIKADGHLEISCSIHHHDGSSPYYVRPYWECEVDSNVLVYQEDWPMITGVWLPASEILLCGEDEIFPYTNSAGWTVATREALVDEFGELVRRALFAPDDPDIRPGELALRLVADELLAELNHLAPRAEFVERCRMFRQALDGWLRHEGKFTVLCRQTNNQGTTYISEGIKAADANQAARQARSACAAEWNCDLQRVHVLGVFEGDVAPVLWEDICDAEEALSHEPD